MKRQQIINPNKHIFLLVLAFCISLSSYTQYSIGGPNSANINETKSFSISNNGGQSIVNTQWSTTSLSSTIVSGQGSTNVNIKFTSIGSGQVRATVLNDSFNSTYLTKNFTVNGTVVGQVSITSGPTSRCKGGGTTDYNASASNATSYSWSITNAGSSTINSSTGLVTWSSTYSGTARVTVVANGPNNSSTTAFRDVVVDPGPSSTPLTASSTSLCSGESAILALSFGSSGVSYELLRNGIAIQSENGANTAINWNPVSSAGNYNVRATKTFSSCDPIIGNTITISTQQDLGSGLVLNITNPSDTTPRCSGVDTWEFDVDGGNSTNTYSNWSVSNAGSSTISGSGRNATVNWAANFGFGNTATVSVLVTSECGDTTTLTRTVTSNSGPSVPEFDQASNIEICSGDSATLSISFSNNGVVYTLYRDGASTNITRTSTSTGQPLSWPVSTAGLYTLRAQGTNGCAESIGTDSVDVDLKQDLGSGLVLNITNPSDTTPRCSGVDTWEFDVDGGNSTNTYSNWSVSNAGSSTISGSGRNATVNWAANFGFGNTATVSVLVTSECGDDITLSTMVTASSGPTEYPLLVKSGDEELCVGGKSVLYIPISQYDVNYTLYRDGGSPDTKPGTEFSERVNWEVYATGTYTLFADDGGSCGTRQMGGPVTIAPATDIEIEITADQDLASICAGTPVTLTVATTNGTTFSDVAWSTGANTESIMVSPLAGSTWTYEVSVRDPNCGNYITESITITPITPTEWYTDSDGDGLGDAFGSPLLSCDDPGGNYVDNNDDSCPDQAGSAGNSGCPPGLEPENRNTVTTWVYDLAGNVKVSNKAYYDELGKLEQTQAYDVKSDSIWASATLYDEYGRTALKTLSAPIREGLVYQFKDSLIRRSNNITEYDLSDYDGANINNPNPVGDAPTTLGWYYSENNTREPYQDVTDYPFSKSVYSNLNPGTVLRTLGGNKVNDIWPQSYAFSMKASGELALNPAFGETEYNSIETTKTVSRDVHGVENVVFTDTDGKVLAAARSGSEGQTSSSSLTVTIPEQGFVDIHIPVGVTGISTSNNNAVTVFDLIADDNASGSFSALTNGFYRVAVNDLDTYVPNSITVTYTVNYYDYSLNEYDEADRLVKSYQPMGSTKATKPVTLYEYNTLGQLIYTKSPDEGEAWFKYREDGQIRYSQNSKQLALSEFSYTNYDSFTRPIESGVVISSGFTTIDPDNGASPTGTKKEQQFTTYDSADNASVATALGSRSALYPAQSFVAGNVTHTLNDHGETWYAYDVYGRVKWLVQQINGLGTKTIDYEYDPIEGLVTKVVYQKEQPDQFIHRYSYNSNDQLVLVETSADDISYEQNAAYSYYEAGALKRTELAGGAQGMDYVYNLQGQLKSINHPSLNAADDPGQDANDLFGMQVDYNSSDYARTSASNITKTTFGTDQLNGNIKSIRWSNANPNTAESQYVYDYDRNNWLTAANFDPSGSAVGTGGLLANDSSNATFANGQTATLQATNSFTLTEGFHAQTGSEVTVSINPEGGGGLMAGDYDLSNITYDANGNILTLNRNKGSQSGNNSMDNLAYTYKTNSQDGPNQLLQVADGVAGNVDSEDIDGQGVNNYVYNTIGQLIRNNEEDVDYFYNTTGLVTEVKKGGLSAVKFYYNDRNHRVRKETYDLSGNSLRNTYYVRDVAGQVMAIYSDATGSTVLKEQAVYGAGRIGVAYAGSGNSKNYVYELTDHLGNVRSVFTKTNAENSLGEGFTDYYPFGMLMPGRNIFGDYRYAFQGQEKDSETGKEAFELRLWDSRIGRWSTIDPAGQYNSPYLGLGNSPLNGIDPNGGKFILGTGITVAQFEAFKIRIKGLLGSDIFDYLDKHPTPITINFLTSDPATGLDGQTTIYKEIRGNAGHNFIANNISMIRLPVNNGNGNNSFLDRSGTNFIALPAPFSDKKFETLSFSELQNRLAGNINITGFDVNVNTNKPFRVFGDELGHVFEALKNPVDNSIFSIIEASLNRFIQGPGHGFDNPSGIRANNFENRISSKIGEKIINPRDF
jgi:RHS repeat-associated protein